MAITPSQAGSYGGHGRKRGNRVRLPVQIPTDLKAALDKAAEDSGLPLTDYVTLVLGRRLGLPDPDYIVIPDGMLPDELDLGLPDRREIRISA